MPQSCSPDLQSPIIVESTPNCAIPTVTISADSCAAFSSRTFQSSDPAELGLMSSQVKINEPAIPPASASFCCKLERGIQKLPLRRSNFSTLQPPTSIKRASTLIKPQEVQRVSVFTGALGRFGATGLSRTRHQPLSAAGLLCINPVRQTTMHSTTAPIFNQQNQGCRQSLLLRNIESRSIEPVPPSSSNIPAFLSQRQFLLNQTLQLNKVKQQPPPLCLLVCFHNSRLAKQGFGHPTRV